MPAKSRGTSTNLQRRWMIQGYPENQPCWITINGAKTLFSLRPLALVGTTIWPAKCTLTFLGVIDVTWQFMAGDNASNLLCKLADFNASVENFWPRHRPHRRDRQPIWICHDRAFDSCQSRWDLWKAQTRCDILERNELEITLAKWMTPDFLSMQSCPTDLHRHGHPPNCIFLPHGCPQKRHSMVFRAFSRETPT